MGTMVLSRGQGYFGHMPRGSVLRVAVGSVALVQYVPLEQAPLVLRRTLSHGAVHVLDSAAWVELQAHDDAQLVLWIPEMASAGWLLGQLQRTWRAALTMLRKRLVIN